MVNPPQWPQLLEGAWYERDKGWGWYGPDGNREPVPAEIIEDAGLPPTMDLPEGLNIVFLSNLPLENRIPRK